MEHFYEIILNLVERFSNSCAILVEGIIWRTLCQNVFNFDWWFRRCVN